MGVRKLVLPLLSMHLCLALSGSVQADIFSTSLDFSSSGPFAFGDVGSGDIVNAATSGADLTSSQSFDIFSGTSAELITLGNDGINDLTFDFAILTGLDVYGAGVIVPLKGVTEDIQQSSSGLRGSVPFNVSGTNNSSTGDVAGYQIKVSFADHLTIHAEDINVLLNSVNTAGEVFESSSVVFNDASGNPFGSATYQGYWSSAPLGAGGASTPAVSTMPYSTSGTGVYLAADTSVINTSDPFNPVAGTSSALDNADPNASIDAGLASGTRVGGFTWTVRLEDVANTLTDNARTSTSVTFSGTLNGVDLGIQINESAAVPEPSTMFLGIASLAVIGLASSARRVARRLLPRFP